MIKDDEENGDYFNIRVKFIVPVTIPKEDVLNDKWYQYSVYFKIHGKGIGDDFLVETLDEKLIKS